MNSSYDLSQDIQLPIYMDNQATTPMDPRVLDSMMPYLTDRFGNAASRSHSFGWQAEQAVDQAREKVAVLIGAAAKEIIFTSGATESDNLAIKGVSEKHRARGNHIITQATEHKAVLDTCKRMEEQGFRVTYLPVDSQGKIDLEDLNRALGQDTILVSIMFANNEIGVIQPIAEIGRLCRERGVLFHTDAVQAVGKIPVDVNAMNIDVLSLSAHKIYGPKGVGALYVRRREPRVQLTAQIDGGGHERGMRSGTLNVPGIVGFGKACEIALQEMAEEAKRLKEMRDSLETSLKSNLDLIHRNGCAYDSLPGNLNMTFDHVDSESLMMGIGDIAVSSGSACTSAEIEPSHVLRAIGLDEEAAHSSIRFGLGRFNTQAEVEYVAQKIIEVVGKLREFSPSYEIAKTNAELTARTH